MKIFGFIIRLLGVMVLLAIGAVAVVANLMDVGEYKTEISQLAERHFARDLDLQGDIDITFFPWLGLSTGRFTLSEPLDFEGDPDAARAPMFSAERATFRIKLFPLLQKRIEIGALTLHRPRLHLLRRVDGRANWDDLAALAGGAPKLAGLAVHGVTIEDGGVIWRDYAGDVPREFAFDALAVRAGKLAPGEAAEVALSVRMSGLWEEAATLDMNTRALLEPGLGAISLDRFHARIDGEDFAGDIAIAESSWRAGLGAFSGIKLRLQLDGNLTQFEAPALTLNLSDASFRLPEMKLQQGDFEIGGKIIGARVKDSPLISARLHARAGDVENVLRRNQIDFEMPWRLDDFDGEFDLLFTGNAIIVNLLTADLELNRRQTILRASDFHFDRATDEVNLGELELIQNDFTLQANGALPSIGRVTARSDDIGAWLARNGLSLALPPGLSDGVDVRFGFEFDGGRLELYDMQGATDGGRAWSVARLNVPVDFLGIVGAVLQAGEW